MTPKGHFEINWPLEKSDPILYTFGWPQWPRKWQLQFSFDFEKVETLGGSLLPGTQVEITFFWLIFYELFRMFGWICIIPDIYARFE